MKLAFANRHITLLLYCLILCGTNLSINGEFTDQSENELQDVKNLQKRDVNSAGILSDFDLTDNNNAYKLHDLDSRFDELFQGGADKRVLETSDGLDLHNFDHQDPKLFLWGDTDDEDNSDMVESEKRGVDRYSFIGALGKRQSDYNEIPEYVYSDDSDKRAPFGFHGQLGKRAPFGFHGQLGKRAPFGFHGQLGKRAPFGFHGQLGKRAPFGFVGQLGKRAPYGFMGQLGKRAPFGFMGQLGKRAPFGFVGQLGKRAPFGFVGQLGKRAPMGFVSQLGKRSHNELFDEIQRLYNIPDNLQRRSPMGFVGQLGKRQSFEDSTEELEQSKTQQYNEKFKDQNSNRVFTDDSYNEAGPDQGLIQDKRSAYELPYRYSRDQYVTPARLVRGMDKLSFVSRLGKRRDINYRFFPQLG